MIDKRAHPAIEPQLFGKYLRDGWTITVAEHEHGYEIHFEDGPSFTVAGDYPDTVRAYIDGDAGPQYHAQG